MMLNTRGLTIPFTKLGAVTSEDLFEEREQEVFDFYEAHTTRYRRALDIGANIGVHTIQMVRCGWEVKAFEPDRVHFGCLMENCAANGAIPRHMARQAVSDHYGRETFVRVLGNTTASHLKGARNHHGLTEECEVEVVDCRPLFDWADFAKIDVEGHEARLLLTVTPRQRCEFLVEIGSLQAAEAIFGHFWGERQMWAQNSGWGAVRGLGDMPTHYRQGMLFIGEKP